MPNVLAIHGGEKRVSIERPHYVWPPITERTREAVLRQLEESISIYDRSGIIERLENRCAEYHGKKHALLTSSGTAGLHSMFVGADVKEGDEVICPAYTFYATVTPLFFTGAVPVLADCTEEGNIDPKDIEKKITGRTKAIVVTHMWGIPGDMEAIKKIAKEYHLLLFEDGSHAHGALYKGEKVGTCGDAAVLSLQGQKTITGGEGGILVTDNDELFYRALLFGHYNKRCKREIPVDHPLHLFAVTGMGLKLRIHPLAAAIADEQFDNLESVLEGRRKTAGRMRNALQGVAGISVPKVGEGKSPSWYGFVMQYNAEELGGLSIERFFEAVVAEGCKELDRPGSTCPLNLHPLFQTPEAVFPQYKGRVRYKKGDFPRAEEFHARSLKLPVWHDPNDNEIVEGYIEALKKVSKHHGDLL